eukprot:7385250-Prymnesium_polylepis.1
MGRVESKASHKAVVGVHPPLEVGRVLTFAAATAAAAVAATAMLFGPFRSLSRRADGRRDSLALGEDEIEAAASEHRGD